MKKSYKWIVTFAVIAVVCAVGSYLKNRNNNELALDEFVPFDVNNADVEIITEEIVDDIFTVNLNTANITELCRLPNIGKSTAVKIIRFRKEYGDFKNVQEIQMVPGIGEKTYAEISKYLTVE